MRNRYETLNMTWKLLGTHFFVQRAAKHWNSLKRLELMKLEKVEYSSHGNEMCLFDALKFFLVLIDFRQVVMCDQGSK